MTGKVRKGATVFILAFIGITLVLAVAPLVGQKKPKLQRSLPYTVLVNLRFSSPFVPDGRMSIAEFAMSVSFKQVVFEFDPENSLLFPFYCNVDTKKGWGTISEFKPNDIEPETPRHPAHFIKPPPARFAASLQVELVGDEMPLIPLDGPPPIVPLVFRTDFGREKITWGASEGSAELDELELRFDVPWPKLMRGEAVSVAVDYKGDWPEDKGKWWIEFIPARPGK
ncbi:MAG: hypothetical protein N2318_01400 [Meiothermus sp.]|nr:hypothetical protein [Meiothermus sp.]